MADVPHLAWPFRLAGNRLVQVEQDSLEDVQQSVYAYLATPLGSRPLSPDFGIDDPTFGPGLNGARLAADIEASEEGRAVVAVVIRGPDEFGQQQITVQVDLPE